MSAGWIPLRRGIIDHLHCGDLTAHEVAAYVLMLLEADRCSGLWWGSAKKLSAEFGAGDVTERTARRALEKLEAGGYVRRFPTPGAHGNYPILIDKFECTDGARKGMRVNAAKSGEWKTPVYDAQPADGQGDGQGQSEESGEDVTSIREGNRNRDRNRIEGKGKGKDPLYAACLESARRIFEESRQQKPAWKRGPYGDFAKLSELVKRKSDLSLEDFEWRFLNFMRSTDTFISKMGGSLGYFADNVDRFMDGEVHSDGVYVDAREMERRRAKGIPCRRVIPQQGEQAA